MRKRNIYNRVSSRMPGRSMFDLSYSKLLDIDMGYLYPVMCDECVPGDIWQIGNEMVIRFQPLVAPILHEINAFVHYFFVPYRILDDTFEDFITGGLDGDDTTEIPRWEPTVYTAGSLWDYLGFPVGVDPDGAYPLAYPMYAYNKIFNEYYLDENIDVAGSLTNEAIRGRRWEKDYFTSALPWQQRGTAPALPISGSTSAVWDSDSFTQTTATTPIDVEVDGSATDYHFYMQDSQARTNAIGAFNDNTVDLSVASTFDIADLRLAFQIQRWMERNARAGARYTEFLKSHFGVSPRDSRLQRPEYIGGSKSPIIISEVLQTSETDTTPQGTLAGHGLSVNKTFVGKYRVEEFGLIMGLLSIMPKAVYQQGINRQWLRETKYDFYFPEFANLSEQAIIRAEIYASGVESENQTIFGYQGRYDEMRTKQNMVVGGMRDTYDYWHMSRQFTSAPILNSTFLQCVPRDDCFAAPSAKQMIVHFGNILRAARPMPISAEPGLIDH